MSVKTLEDVKYINFTSHDTDGSLVALEENNEIPFEIKRIFYVKGVKTLDYRGCHSHHKTEQVLVCLNGKVTVVCHDGTSEEKYVLDKHTKGLYIPNEVWDSQVYHSSDTILLVLSNTNYDKEDYIENFDDFLKGKQK